MKLSKEAKNTLAKAEKDSPQKAYDQLKPVAAQCAALQNEAAKDPAKVQGYINLIEYNSDLAVAAYAAGDKAQAKVYAAQGIKLNESRTPEQSRKISQDQIPTLNAALVKMYDIQENSYQYTPPQNIGSGEAQ